LKEKQERFTELLGRKISLEQEGVNLRRRLDILEELERQHKKEEEEEATLEN